MRQIVRYVNSRNEEITFDGSVALKKIEGISENSVSHSTYQGVMQNGETYKYSSIEKKEITIDFNIVSSNPTEYMELRDELLRVFNPTLGEGYLYYEYNGIEVRIKCIADGTPRIPSEGRKYYTEGSVTLLAFNPFFEDVAETLVVFEGVTYGTLNSKVIPNGGHVKTPLKITVDGPCNAPVIAYTNYNEPGNPQKAIRVNKAITTGQSIVITTGYGDKKVTIVDGEEEANAFNYIDLDTEFFELDAGANNTIVCRDASNEATSNATITIAFRKRYLGV